MDCKFVSFAIVVLKMFFIIAVKSGSSEKNSTELLQAPNDENSTELLSGPNEEGSVERLQEPNDNNSTDLLIGSVEENSVEQPQGPNGDSGESVIGPNDGSSKESLHVQSIENAGTDKNSKYQYVELDVYDNETVTAKLVEEDGQEENQEQDGQEKENQELDNRSVNDDKSTIPHNRVKLINHSYLDVDKNHADLDTSEIEVSDSGSDLKDENQKQEDDRYLEELKLGNKAESYGSNPHYYQPKLYPELSRRFVPHYPYKEDEGINLVKKDARQKNLDPMLASPDLVLAVAKESAMLDAASPKKPYEYLIEKNTLRSGNYWNAIWKEEVNPKVLRSNSRKPLGVIPVKINPGSNIYDLVTKLKQISPRLLYVINKKIKY